MKTVITIVLSSMVAFTMLYFWSPGMSLTEFVVATGLIVFCLEFVRVALASVIKLMDGEEENGRG